ncbi:MAG TPA: hypothetical protein VGD02_04805, partial [Gemmatimonadaceae bacterium]
MLARCFLESLTDGAHIVGELLKAGIISLRLRTNEKISTLQVRQELRAHDLAQASFDTIPLDDFSLVLWNDHPHPGMQQQGGANPGLEAFGLDSLPGASYRFEVGLARQPRVTRKPKRFRRRRISTVVGLSAAYVPSCDAGLA